MERTAAVQWVYLSASLGVFGAALPLALVYIISGSVAGVLYLAAVSGLLMIPMFMLALYWGYRLRVASAASLGWSDEQRRGLMRAILWITASIFPALFAIAGLRSGVSAGNIVALALYGAAQLLGLRGLSGVYKSKLAEALPGGSGSSAAPLPTPRLALVYAFIIAGALLGCLAVVLLYSGRVGEGALASIAAAVFAAVGARKLLNVSHAAQHL